jgi:hypothetical protein
MAKRTYRKRKAAPKTKWARKQKPKRKPRFKLNKKQQAQFDFLMSGGRLDDQSE